MNVLIYGLGRSGMAAANLVAKQGHQLYYYDQKLIKKDQKTLADLGAIYTNDFENPAIDICIAAPGVSYDNQDLINLRNRGIETIGEVEWVYRTFDSEIIGITGTAGKGSITRWVADLLNSANIPAVVGGNIDPALSKVASEDKVLVVELSSFQLERCPKLKPSIAVIANLDVDHLDYHKTKEKYHQAKKNILKNLDEQSIFIYNQDEQILRNWASESQAKSFAFSMQDKADAFLKNDEIILFNKALISIKKLNFRAKHFIANALAASLVAHAKGMSHTQIATVLKSLRVEDGRYSLVAKKNNIVYIEDSIATRTLAVKAGLESTPAPIVWIAGGVNKGADFKQLGNLLKEKVVLVLTIGQSAAEFASKSSQYTKAESTELKSGHEALKWAIEKAKQRLTKTGGTVLFAPLASSFDQFDNYKHRAQVFREIVAAVK